VHRRLQQLQKEGLMQLRAFERDNRPRIIEPAGATHAWFARLGSV
jgi:hypothetical protein